MSGNPEFVVPVPTDGPQADANLREQRESLRDILASTADVVLATDSTRPLVAKLQLGSGVFEILFPRARGRRAPETRAHVAAWAHSGFSDSFHACSCRRLGIA